MKKLILTAIAAGLIGSAASSLELFEHEQAWVDAGNGISIFDIHRREGSAYRYCDGIVVIFDWAKTHPCWQSYYGVNALISQSEGY